MVTVVCDFCIVVSELFWLADGVATDILFAALDTGSWAIVVVGFLIVLIDFDGVAVAGVADVCMVDVELVVRLMFVIIIVVGVVVTVDIVGGAFVSGTDCEDTSLTTGATNSYDIL
mgnify:FL=1